MSEISLPKKTRTSSDCIFASVVLASYRNQRIAMSLQNGETSFASILLDKSFTSLDLPKNFREFPGGYPPTLGGDFPPILGGQIPYLTFLGSIAWNLGIDKNGGKPNPGPPKVRIDFFYPINQPWFWDGDGDTSNLCGTTGIFNISL